MGGLFREGYVHAGRKREYSHTAARDGNKPGEPDVSRMMEMVGGRDEEIQRKRLGEPVRTIVPHRDRDGSTGKAKDGSSGTTLMKLINSSGEQEIAADSEKNKTSFTVTAKRPDQPGGLGEDMRTFERDKAQKQIRTGGYNLFLAGGKKEGAASVEAGLSGRWTDKKVARMLGDDRSSMLEKMCPYADDAGEREKITDLKEQLAHVRSRCLVLQQESSSGSESAAARLTGLKVLQSKLEKRLGDLNELVAKKAQVKRLMLQKLNHASDSRSFAGIRSKRSLSGLPANMALDGTAPDSQDERNGDGDARREAEGSIDDIHTGNFESGAEK